MKLTRAVRRRDLMEVAGRRRAGCCPQASSSSNGGRAPRPPAEPSGAVRRLLLHARRGVNEGAFWPTGTETDFQLSPILTPFAPYKDKAKMLVLGPQMSGAAPTEGTGLTLLACAAAPPTPIARRPSTRRSSV